ncbi:MAG: metallophosphoesterase family protein [Mycobacteriales bacterium]
MRLHVVSDVHGQAEALARAGEGADALICLGDLILFVDYVDPSAGIMGTLFGPENVARFVGLRTARRFEEARAFSGSLWQTLADPRATIRDAVRAQYAEMFAALPDRTFLTYGNVDLPELFDEFLRPGLELLDGAATDIDGVRVGFVGGGLPTPMRTPYEVPESEYAAKVAALGPVDVLASHIPPHLPELLYDSEAGRFERGSVAVLEAIQQHQPEVALFGHVHQAHTRRVRIGRTRCVNVGHFRSRQQPFVLEV